MGTAGKETEVSKGLRTQVCLRHCRTFAAACKLQTKMSEMTSPSPSQPSGADGVRIKRLERELAELKLSQSIQSQNHNKALDDIDKLEAYVERLIADKARVIADAEAASRHTNRPEGSSMEKGTQADEALQARIMQLEKTVKDRESDVVAASTKDWAAVVPVLDSALYQQNLKFLKARKLQAEEKKKLVERTKVLEERNIVLEEQNEMLQGKLSRARTYALQYDDLVDSGMGLVDSTLQRTKQQAKQQSELSSSLERIKNFSKNGSDLLIRLKDECTLEQAGTVSPTTESGPHIISRGVQGSGSSNTPPASITLASPAAAKTSTLAPPPGEAKTPSSPKQLVADKKLKRPETTSASGLGRKILKTSAEILANPPERHISSTMRLAMELHNKKPDSRAKSIISARLAHLKALQAQGTVEPAKQSPAEPRTVNELMEQVFGRKDSKIEGSKTKQSSSISALLDDTMGPIQRGMKWDDIFDGEEPDSERDLQPIVEDNTEGGVRAKDTARDAVHVTDSPIEQEPEALDSSAEQEPQHVDSSPEEVSQFTDSPTEKEPPNTDSAAEEKQWSAPESEAAQALPERVPRSSAENELLRLKDRKSLNRLTPL